MGHPIHALPNKARLALQKRHIGFVFQSYHLLDDLTVYENIELPLSYRDVKASDRQSIVAEVLDRFRIVAKKDLYPSQLSGGQQQLVGVARAVAASPSVILADEPTGNLHSSQAREIMELFKQLNDQGTTIVQVTHSEENARFGGRIIRLRDGFMEERPAGVTRDAGTLHTMASLKLANLWRVISDVDLERIRASARTPFELLVVAEDDAVGQRVRAGLGAVARRRRPSLRRRRRSGQRAAAPDDAARRSCWRVRRRTCRCA